MLWCNGYNSVHIRLNEITYILYVWFFLYKGGFVLETFIRIFRDKRLVLALLLIYSIILLSSCGQTGDKAGNKTIVLRLAHFFPSSHPAEKELVAGWAKEIEKATDGAVKIVSYADETLGKAPDIYNGVIEGVADIGLSCFSYTPGRFPIMQVLELPGIIYKNSYVASMTAWEFIKQVDPEELKDTKLMMVLATGSGDLFTREPVKMLEDLNGKIIRATGASAPTISALGATPEAMSQAETYEALQKNMVDGNLGPIEVLQTWNHADYCKYITKTPFLYNTLFFITMNLDKWNSLPPDIQEKILEVNEDYQKNVAAGLWDKQNEVALNWAVNEKGMEVFELTEEETTRWIKQVEKVQEDAINKNGLIDRELIELVKEIADKYNDMF